MELKPALSYEEQIEHLKVYNNLQVNDDDEAIRILKRVSDKKQAIKNKR